MIFRITLLINTWVIAFRSIGLNSSRNILRYRSTRSMPPLPAYSQKDLDSDFSSPLTPTKSKRLLMCSSENIQNQASSFSMSKRYRKQEWSIRKYAKNLRLKITNRGPIWESSTWAQKSGRRKVEFIEQAEKSLKIIQRQCIKAHQWKRWMDQKIQSNRSQIKPIHQRQQKARSNYQESAG